MDYLEQQYQEPVQFELKKIVSHSGPLRHDHPSYQGSTYNVGVEWANGDITQEPLTIIAEDAPLACATYAREADLLDKPGWKRFK